MADNYSMCLLGVMDRLWFHQIILFPEPNSILLPKIIKSHEQQQQEEFLAESFSSCTQSILTHSTLPEEDFSSISSAIFPPRGDTDIEMEENEIERKQERPTRLNLMKSKSRSESSSPLTPQSPKSPKKLKYLGSVTRLQKTMSCKTLLELELEEVKGVLDLGFNFKKEHLCPRMMSLIPGLQRIGDCKREEIAKFLSEEEEKEKEKEKEKKGEELKGVMRPPYLSEAWLIKTPDSPLLNIRIPRVSGGGDNMKQHLKYWARTVASVIQHVA